GEIASRARRGLGVLAGEHGREMLGLDRVLERDRDRRAGHPCRAAADGVDDHQGRAFAVLKLLVDLLGGPQLLDPEPGEVLPHGRDETLVVHLLGKTHMQTLKPSKSVSAGCLPRYSSRTSARIAACGTTRYR